MKKIPVVARKYGNLSHPQNLRFARVPDNIREHSIRTGFELNVLVVGRRGLGTSTLVNALFAAPIVSKDRGNGLSVTKNQIIENSVSLETIVITYHNDDIKPLIEHINELNMCYFENEQGSYKTHQDKRVHACIYLMPSDHITETEISNMQKLSQLANFIPVIPKADMYTEEELNKRKNEVSEILESNGIEYFIPTPMDNDEETLRDIECTCEAFPFAIIASETVYEHEGEIIRGRRYPWGFINIELEQGNDFKKLQRMLIYSHLEDLIVKTDGKFYNQFRKRTLELEKGSQSIQMARYNKLKNEMENILRDKYRKKIEELKLIEMHIEKMFSENSQSAEACCENIESDKVAKVQ